MRRAYLRTASSGLMIGKLFFFFSVFKIRLLRGSEDLVKKFERVRTGRINNKTTTS